MLYVFLFSSRRRHTRYWRDWSSDVCSSDLGGWPGGTGGERTSHLFRLANHQHGLVVGTGDLSELALGWSTYGVGDHMSHYNVNVSVPKTLIQYLIGWVANSGQFNEAVGKALARVLATDISP